MGVVVLFLLFLLVPIAVMVAFAVTSRNRAAAAVARAHPLPFDPRAPVAGGGLADFSADVDYTYGITSGTQISGKIVSRMGGAALTFQGNYRQRTGTAIRDGHVDATGPGGAIRLVLRGTSIEVWTHPHLCAVIHPEAGVITSAAGPPMARIDPHAFHQAGGIPYRLVDFGGRHVYLCDDYNGDAGTALFLGAWPQLSAAEQAVLVGLAIVVRVLPHVHRRGGL